jgi:site-specific recombinase XerD
LVVNVQLSKEGAMSNTQHLLDAAGRRRSPATMPEFHAGRARHAPGRAAFLRDRRTHPRPCLSASAARLQLHQIALEAGVRRRLAPPQLRHAHAVELLHEEIPLPLIQRHLGHSHRSTTGTYLQGIFSEEIVSTVHARRAPMMHASAGLDL